VCTELQSLILAGHIGQAISLTDELYPGLLDQNLDLLFALKCRQFIEIVNGTDGETVPTECLPPRLLYSMRLSHCMASGRHSSASNTVHTSPHSGSSASHRTGDNLNRLSAANGDHTTNGAALNLSNSATNADKNSMNGESTRLPSSDCRLSADLDTDMDTSESGEERTALNGVSTRRTCLNGSTAHSLAVDNNTSSCSSDCDDKEIDLEDAVMGL